MCRPSDFPPYENFAEEEAARISISIQRRLAELLETAARKAAAR